VLDAGSLTVAAQSLPSIAISPATAVFPPTTVIAGLCPGEP
jgi:hypothetical protein